MNTLTNNLFAILRWTISNSRRLAVLIVGMALLGAGLAMLTRPGPGLVVLIAGLAVLATEFAWAERMLDKTRSRAAAATESITASRSGKIALALSAIAMVSGGAVVAIINDRFRSLGVAALIAGLCALAVCLPAVQQWINRSGAGTIEPLDEEENSSVRVRTASVTPGDRIQRGE